MWAFFALQVLFPNTIYDLIYSVAVLRDLMRIFLFQSYNSYLFNDFTAIYKLLADQLHTKGSIDMKPIKDWLRQGGYSDRSYAFIWQ